MHSCNLQQGCSLTEICNEFCSCKYHQFTLPPSRLSLPHISLSLSLHSLSLSTTLSMRHVTTYKRKRKGVREIVSLYVCLSVCVCTCFNTIVIVTIPPPPIALQRAFSIAYIRRCAIKKGLVIFAQVFFCPDCL